MAQSQKIKDWPGFGMALQAYGKRSMDSINWLEKNWNNFENNKISMDQISVACALEYTKFRFTDKWTNNCNNLSIWLKKFNKHKFMELTIPKDI